MPQQALALANSELALREARQLARSLAAANDEAFVTEVTLRILCRRPTKEELRLCLDFLHSPPEGAAAESARDPGRARANLVLVLFNHNEFVTVR
jgi:hypothetical protein